jgi:hypothetical protein
MPQSAAHRRSKTDGLDIGARQQIDAPHETGPVSPGNLIEVEIELRSPRCLSIEVVLFDVAHNADNFVTRRA